MIKKTIIIITILINSFSIQAMPIWGFDNPHHDNNLPNFFYGGGFGLGFSSNNGFVDFSPLAGIYLFKNAAVGLGTTYAFYFGNDGISKYHAHVFGGRIFARYYIYSFYGHIEYELLNFDSWIVDPFNFQNLNDRITEPSVLGGLGYRAMITERVFATISILFNLHETPNSFYQSPIIYRTGIIINI